MNAMNVRRYPLRTYALKWFCENPDCLGEMLATGHTTTTDPIHPDRLEHQCTICGFRADSDFPFPRTESEIDPEALDARILNAAIQSPPPQPLSRSWHPVTMHMDTPRSTARVSKIQALRTLLPDVLADLKSKLPAEDLQAQETLSQNLLSVYRRTMTQCSEPQLPLLALLETCYYLIQESGLK